MNITDANRFIHALNRLAEGVTMLAGAIEEAAWESFEDHVGMPGVRPIAAAQLAQPALQAVAEEYEAACQPPTHPSTNCSCGAGVVGAGARHADRTISGRAYGEDPFADPGHRSGQALRGRASQVWVVVYAGGGDA